MTKIVKHLKLGKVISVVAVEFEKRKKTDIISNLQTNVQVIDVFLYKIV